MELHRLFTTIGLLLFQAFCVQSRCSGFTCMDGTCLASASYRCDSQTQCPDKSDESNCTDCRLGYPCENGHCTFLANRCNGRNDCMDNSDELNCGITTAAATTAAMSQTLNRLGLTIGIPVAAALVVGLPIIGCVTVTCILCCIAKSKRTSVHPLPSGTTNKTAASNKTKASGSKSDHQTPSIQLRKSHSYATKSHTESAADKKSLIEQRKSVDNEQKLPQVIEVHPVPGKTSQSSVSKKLSGSDHQSGPHGHSESQFSKQEP